MRSLSVASQRLLFGAGFVVVLLLLAVQTTRRNQGLRTLAETGSQSTVPVTVTLPTARIDTAFEPGQKAVIAIPPATSYPERPADSTRGFGEPRVTYSAELAVATKEFARARSAMEEILDRHRGYTAKLRMVGQSSGSVLSATLRVPASEYSSALADLKSVGRVDRDEESADEVIQQHGELEARWQNAQNNVHRLERMLKEKSATPSLALLQQQLGQMRSEIERLEAERRALENRGIFSNIYFSLSEVHVTPAESFATQLRGAALAGLSDAMRTISAILIFCVNYGPSLLLWAAILFFPARTLWRRSSSALARNTAQALHNPS
jgi:uncharacterized small protein (DUF1192 family)